MMHKCMMKAKTGDPRLEFNKQYLSATAISAISNHAD